MEFRKVVFTSELLSPSSLERDLHTIEYRQDPLTGEPCRINVRRTKRLKKAAPGNVLREVAGSSRDCPFCPHNVQQATSLFARDFCPEGRIATGECCLFPNLFPLAEHHAVGVLTSKHMLDLDEFGVGTVVDSLMATRRYLEMVDSREGESKYPIYLWNHLQPSAASMVHPHIQVMVDRWPTPYQKTLLDRSREYFQQTGRSFWEDLVDEEKRSGERFIGERGSVAALAGYAPQGNREVRVICRGEANLMDLSETDMGDFADCLIRLLRGYKQMGINSFNLSTFSAALGERLDYYALNAKLIARPVLQPFYRNDTGILERFHHDADIDMAPEEVARSMKAAFEAQG
jgi:UDPglucose--hexose-1-phosphate uridylyltransferase